jgi:hypothetical protein
VTAGRSPIHNHRQGFFVHAMVDFIQILFATERMLDSTEGPAQKRGSARTTRPVPMVPPAPPAFSIVICWPRIFDMACAAQLGASSAGIKRSARTWVIELHRSGDLRPPTKTIKLA